MLRVLRNGKRRYTAAFKAWVAEQCLRPGTSLAGIAPAQGLNATMLRKWVVQHKQSMAAMAPETAAVQLLPVEVQTRSTAAACAAVAAPAIANTVTRRPTFASRAANSGWHVRHDSTA